MNDKKKPRHTPNNDEPNFLPSKPEGSEDTEPLTEHLRTPGKAEGSREDVEETLRHQKKNGNGKH